MTTLAKVGGAVVGSTLGSLTRRFRVARRVSKNARLMGISVSARAIRRWLKRRDVRAQFESADPNQLSSTLKSLDLLVERSRSTAAEPMADKLFAVVVDAVLRSVPASDSTAIQTGYLTQNASGNSQRVIDAVNEASGEILDVVRARASFNENLVLLAPVRSDQAVALEDAWPEIRDLLLQLKLATSRVDTLAHWATEVPPFLAAAPPAGLAWFGELVHDYGLSDLAYDVFRSAATRGAPDPGYWLARALALKSEDVAAGRISIEDVCGPPTRWHPLARAISHAIQRKWADARVALDEWQPKDRSAALIRAGVVSRCYQAEGRLDDAVEVLSAANDDPERVPGGALQLAELLLAKTHSERGTARMETLRRAERLASAARNGRRRWGGDAVPAVLLLIDLAITSGDSGRARAHCTAAPGGEATVSEASDSRIVERAAILAALRGNHEQAETMAATAESTFVTAFVLGWKYLATDDLDPAHASFMEAWTHARTETERLQVASVMATLGRGMPDVARLHDVAPDEVDELGRIHSALQAQGEQRLRHLRAIAPDSTLATSLLADELNAKSDTNGAALAWQTRAERAGEPGLMAVASSAAMSAGRPDDALNLADSALALGGQEWSGRRGVLITKFEAFEAMGAPERSLTTAQELVGLNAGDVDSRWALAMCWLRLGDNKEAWSALQAPTGTVDPRTIHEASAWVGLTLSFDSSSDAVQRVVAVVSRWASASEEGGRLLAQVFAHARVLGEPGREEDAKALREAAARFVEENPGSPTFRTIPIPDDDEGIRRALSEEMGKSRGPGRAELAKKITDGSLPLGVASAFAGRAYLEVLINPPTVHVRASAYPLSAERVPREAFSEGVVLDASAAVSLARLGDALRSDLFSVLPQVVATGAQVADARVGVESFAIQSGLWADVDDQTGELRVSEVEASDLEAFRELSRNALGVLTLCRARPWVLSTRLAALSGPEAWRSAGDMAAKETKPFWCDDHVLASAVRSEGGLPFSSVDLLSLALREGVIDQVAFEFALARLLQARFVDLGFNANAFELAAQLDGWRAKGTATALARRAAWNDPAEVAKFLWSAARNATTNGPHEVAGWIAWGAQGCALAAGSGEGAGHNLAVLMLEALRQPWISPEILRQVLKGVRASAEHLSREAGLRCDLDLHEPLERFFSELVESHGHALATQVMIQRVSMLAAEDRQLAVSVILAP